MLSVNDGQQYMCGDSMMFTYFPVAAVTGLSVTRIRPLGGPSAGGTLVHLRGARLTNLGGQVTTHTVAHPLMTYSSIPSPTLLPVTSYFSLLTPYSLRLSPYFLLLNSYSSAALPVLDVARACARNLAWVRAPHTSPSPSPSPCLAIAIAIAPPLTLTLT